jgi:hypothetical protein
MKTVKLLVLMQIVGGGVLDAGTSLHILTDQTGVDSGKIRLQHPEGFAIVIDRKHCTAPYEPIGRPIPLLYATADLCAIGASVDELNAWGKRLSALCNLHFIGEERI